MKRDFMTEAGYWVLYNFILPSATPLLFAWFGCMIVFHIGDGLYDSISLLVQNGVYTFLGFAMLISLFDDFRKAPQVSASPLFLITLIIDVIITGFVFIDSLGVSPIKANSSDSTAVGAIISVTAAVLMASVILKYKIVQSINSSKN